MLGIKLKMSNAYQPKIDAQTERTNRILEDMLRNYVRHKQMTWEQYLFLVEFAYNVSWHSSIKTNPFYALHGQECPLSISIPTFKMEGINQMIATMHHTLKLVKESLQSAQDQANFYAYINYTPQEFEMNDWVFL
jgi:hypothetical protein